MQSKSRLWPFCRPLPLLLMLGCFLAVPAAAATFTVLNLSDSGPGSLRQAVLDANAAAGADVVDFQTGLTGTITLTSDEILITDSVDIAGPGAGVLTVDGNGDSRIFRVQNALADVQVTLSGLTLTHGSARFGGAVAVFGGSLTLRGMVLSGNEALFAGGNVYVQPGSLLVQESTISGGVSDDGGGIAVDEGLLVIDRSTLSGNQGDNGGAIHTASTLAQIVSSTISGNSATTHGGGVFGEALSTFEVRHTTVAGNVAGIAGGSFYVQRASILDFDHAIVADGTPQDLVQTESSVGAIWSLIEAPAGAINGLNVNNLLGVDPSLAPLADNGGPTQTHALLPDSPALNAGNPTIANAPATDQRGFPRIAGGRIDLGSFEEQLAAGALVIPSLSEIGLLVLATLLAGTGVLAIRR